MFLKGGEVSDQVPNNRKRLLAINQLEEYFNTKLDWFRDRLDELKKIAEQGMSETKRFDMIQIMEVINLEISIDQNFLASQELNGMTGYAKKKSDVYKEFLVNLSHRVKFYSDTHIRGM